MVPARRSKCILVMDNLCVGGQWLGRARVVGTWRRWLTWRWCLPSAAEIYARMREASLGERRIRGSLTADDVFHSAERTAEEIGSRGASCGAGRLVDHKGVGRPGWRLPSLPRNSHRRALVVGRQSAWDLRQTCWTTFEGVVRTASCPAGGGQTWMLARAAPCRRSHIWFPRRRGRQPAEAGRRGLPGKAIERLRCAGRRVQQTPTRRRSWRRAVEVVARADKI